MKNPFLRFIRRASSAWRRIGLIARHPLKAIVIEVNAHCNRRCPWCPNHAHPREAAWLDEQLYAKILGDLGQMRFGGRLTFNMYNEPLLDKRLPRLVEEARAALPRSFLYLNTNGDLLSPSRWRELRAAGLDYALVSQYDGAIAGPITELLSQLDDGDRQRIHVRMFDATRDGFNRAGNIASCQAHPPALPLRKFCARPFFQLCVDYRGKAVLCCNDFFGEVEMGDVRCRHIADIWNGAKFRQYRRRLALGDRASLPLCEKCDMTADRSSLFWEFGSETRKVCHRRQFQTGLGGLGDSP